MNQLTKYPIAGVRELLALSFPLVLSAFSAALLCQCDRYFLSHYSLQEWEACSAATGLCFFYQMSLIMIATAAQVFIGQFQGAKKHHLIGPFTWQIIWFSLLSMLITYPLSLISTLYVHGSEIQEPATLYFKYLSSVNFLYPLGAALSAFYIGRGKTRVILLVNLTIQSLNIGLDYLLIFGVQGWIPPMGIKGAAIATMISQSLLCIILLSMFLQKKHIPLYRTDQKGFNRHLLWEGLKTGIPRALARIMAVGSWLVASYLMVQKGGDYLLVLSFGGSIFLIFSFINEGMAQALITITSHILGANIKNTYYKKIVSASLIFLTVTVAILAIPLLGMQDTLISIFIDEPLSPESTALLKECCIWVWVICVANGINRIGTSLNTAARDTLYHAIWNSILWITLCIPVYIGIGQYGWSPSKFFLIDGINCILIGVVLILRFLKESFKKRSFYPIRAEDEKPLLSPNL